MTTPDESLRAAFLTVLAADVNAVLKALPMPRTAPTRETIGAITLGGEPLQIPARIYCDEALSEIIASLTETQQRVLHCLYTRHHDGFVRQRHLGFLLASNEVWTAPFVVQLVGEYVLPIVVQIERELGALHEAHFSAFLMENEAFLRLTSARVRSYWNAYFRSHDVPRSAHPGEVVLRRFEEWVKPRQAPCCETMHAPRGSTQGV